MTFPRILDTWGDRTDIAIGYGMPSERTDGPEFKPLCLIVISVRTSNAESEIARLREGELYKKEAVA